MLTIISKGWYEEVFEVSFLFLFFAFCHILHRYQLILQLKKYYLNIMLIVSKHEKNRIA